MHGYPALMRLQINIRIFQTFTASNISINTAPIVTHYLATSKEANATVCYCIDPTVMVTDVYVVHRCLDQQSFCAMVHFGVTVLNYGLLYAYIQYISMVYSTDTAAAHYIQYAYMLDVIVVCLSTLQII